VSGPETVDGFEIGSKFGLLGGALRGDVTIYDYVYKDLQVSALRGGAGRAIHPGQR
jgi:outer membrane receptor protein involved in Fe transport